MIVATGLRHEADVILTGDARWKGIETVRVVGTGDRWHHRSPVSR